MLPMKIPETTKRSFNPFPSKAETEHQSSFELMIFPLMEAYITNSFWKQTAKNCDILAYVVNYIFMNFPIIIKFDVQVTVRRDKFL